MKNIAKYTIYTGLIVTILFSSILVLAWPNNSDSDFLKFTNQNTIEIVYTNWKNLKTAHNYNHRCLFTPCDDDYNLDNTMPLYSHSYNHRLWNIYFNLTNYNHSTFTTFKLKNLDSFLMALEFIEWEADIRSDSEYTVMKFDKEYDMNNIKSFFDDNFNQVRHYKDFNIYNTSIPEENMPFLTIGNGYFVYLNLQKHILILSYTDNSEIIDIFNNNTNFRNVNKHFLNIAQNFKPILSCTFLSDKSPLYNYQNGVFEKAIQQLKSNHMRQGEGSSSSNDDSSSIISPEVLEKLREEYNKDSDITNQLNNSKAVAFGFNIESYTNKKNQSHNINSRIVISFNHGVEKHPNLREKIYNNLYSSYNNKLCKDILPIKSYFEDEDLLIYDFNDFNQDDNVLLRALWVRDSFFQPFLNY